VTRERLLETARWVAMVLGAFSAIIAAAAFRVAIYDEAVFEAKGISAAFTILVGGSLFLRAYWAGTTRRELPGKPDFWDHAVAWIEDHGAVVALVILTAIGAVVYAGVFLGESVGDDLTFHMAESARLADCIRAGDWDLWNPSANAGFASAYYYQVLPQLASAIPTAIFGHHLFWFQLSLWLPLVAIPLAGYRGMRLMGATPWQSLAAAFALTFVSGASRWGTGADGTFQVGLYTQTWALAAFPLGLGHAVRYLTERKGLAPAVGWGTFVFLCHPFASIALCLGLAVGVLAHYLGFPVRDRRIKLALLGVLAVLLAGVVLLLIVDRPVPPDNQPNASVAPIKYFYVAPAIALILLIARVTTSRRTLAYVLIGAAAIAILIQIVGFATTTIVPKRPEGATEDLPAEWQFGAASLYIGPILLLGALIGRLAIAVRGELRDGDDPPDSPRPSRDQFVRLVILGGCLLVATLPGWLTVIVDRDGFGGFPHRVWDEVGPGYKELSRWYTKGQLLDHARIAGILTWSLPAVVLFARMKFGRWLWAPAITYATLLALGPHVPKTADDLLPAVRFLGAMQVILALAIGAGLYAAARSLWNAGPEHPIRRLAQRIAGTRRPADEVAYGVRTALIAGACAWGIFVGMAGAHALSLRVNVLEAFDYAPEMFEMIDIVDKQPPGRKQVGPGAESHWWNLLTYVYGKRPALLQMGGGGLQASPNYDFVYSVREFPKLAWVYDTPLFVYAKKNGNAPPGEVIGSTANYELLRLPAPGIVSPIQITGVLPEGESRAGSPVRKAAIDWLKSDAPLSDHHLAYAGYGGPGPAPDAKVLRALSVDPSPGDMADIYAEVEVHQPTTFVARESWHPRWHAYVDGTEVPIRRVTPDFPAIDVAAGNHVLAFRFERPWWATASWLAWPAITLGAWWIGRRRRRQLPTARVVET